MSATVSPATKEEPSKEERLKSFLTEKAADGEMYFKSKFIADEVGLSPKEIGALMVKLKDSASELRSREVVLHQRDHVAHRTRVTAPAGPLSFDRPRFRTHPVGPTRRVHRTPHRHTPG